MKNNPPRDDLMVCVCSPFHANFKQALRLVEYIEIYKMMGAKKFYIYNDYSSSNVQKVLDYYQNQSTVEVIEWLTHKGLLYYLCFVDFFRNFLKSLDLPRIQKVE